MASGFDAAFSVERVLPRISALAPRVDFVARYYGGSHSKDLTRSEAAAILVAGLDVVTVYEARGDQLGWFTPEQGARDAGIALQQAADCGQPPGSAVYFAYDRDFSADEMQSHGVPYMRAVHAALRGRYRPGVYGSGLVGVTLMDAGLIDYFWLAQSRGWRDYARGRALAHLVQGGTADYGIGGRVDTDQTAGDYGGWRAAGHPPAPGPAPSPSVAATAPSRGDVVATVTTLQEQLQARGEYRGQIDGDPGPQTQDALTAFRRDGVA